MDKLTRRQLVNAMGLGAGTLFLPSLLGDKKAEAQGPPRRLMLFHAAPHGPIHGNWRMRRPGLPDQAADWEFPLDDPDPMSFSETLRELHEFRQDLLVLEGLSYASTYADTLNANTHIQSACHSYTNVLTRAAKMTGQGPNGAHGGISFDQVIANKVAVPGRFKYLYAGEETATSFSPVSDASGNQINFEKDPVAFFSRIWPGGSGGGGGGGGGDPYRRDKSVIAVVRERYQKILPRLGPEDKRRLTQHFDLIRDREAEIIGRAGIVCAAPAQPTKQPLGKNMSAFSQMLAAAMACDLTRVGHLYRGQLAPTDFGGPATAAVHADIAHKAYVGSANERHMIDYYKVHTREFAGLVRAFKDRGLLESTAIVWTSQLGNPVHSMGNDRAHLMVVIAGRLGGAIRTGRYVKYAEPPHPTLSFSYLNGDKYIGPPISKLWIALMNAMGVDVNSFGLTEAKGMNLTGALHKLT